MITRDMVQEKGKPRMSVVSGHKKSICLGSVIALGITMLGGTPMMILIIVDPVEAPFWVCLIAARAYALVFGVGGTAVQVLYRCTGIEGMFFFPVRVGWEIVFSMVANGIIGALIGLTVGMLRAVRQKGKTKGEFIPSG